MNIHPFRWALGQQDRDDSCLCLMEQLRGIHQAVLGGQRHMQGGCVEPPNLQMQPWACVALAVHSDIG